MPYSEQFYPLLQNYQAGLFLQDSDSEPEIVKGLSGDEVDTKNIVTGGRGARRGRATQAAHQMAKYKQKAQDSDEDSW